MITAHSDKVRLRLAMRQTRVSHESSLVSHNRTISVSAATRQSIAVRTKGTAV